MSLPTVEDVARALDLSVPDAPKNATLRLALDAAVEAVADYTGRTWTLIDDATEPTTRTYPGGGRQIVVADVEQADTTVEESYDLSSWTDAVSGWHFEPLNESTAVTLDRHDGCMWAPWVRVTGRHGHFAIPSAVRQATILKAAALFDRRTSSSGVLYGNEFGPIRISRFEDPDVARLLDTVESAASVGIA